jgi:hypothetical protein
VPAAIELIDSASLRAVEALRQEGRRARTMRGAAVIVEVRPERRTRPVDAEMMQVVDAVPGGGGDAAAPGGQRRRAREIWDIRRQVSLALRAHGPAQDQP